MSTPSSVAEAPRGAFAQASDRVADALALVAAVCIAAAIVVINYMIVKRAFGGSAWWEIEAGVYLLVTATFLGSPYTLKTQGHVGIDLLPLMLKGAAGRILRLTVAFAGLLTCLFLAWKGFGFAYDAWAIGERADSMWAPPLWPVKATMVIGMAGTAIVYVAQILEIAAGSATAGAPAMPVHGAGVPAAGAVDAEGARR